MDEDLRYIHHFGLIAPPFRASWTGASFGLATNSSKPWRTSRSGSKRAKAPCSCWGTRAREKACCWGASCEVVAGEIATAILREAWISVDRFFNFLAAEFKIDKAISTKGDFLTHFRTFLLAAFSEGRKFLLVVETRKSGGRDSRTGPPVLERRGKRREAPLRPAHWEQRTERETDGAPAPGAAATLGRPMPYRPFSDERDRCVHPAPHDGGRRLPRNFHARSRRGNS